MSTTSANMHGQEPGGERGPYMAAEPNISGMARLLYIVGGVGVASWGLWGADPGWTMWTWLAVGGCILVQGPDWLLPRSRRSLAQEGIESELNAFPARGGRFFSSVLNCPFQSTG